MSLPISLNVRGRLIAIIGGGEVAFRKACIFGEAEARLRVVAPRIDSQLERFAREHGFEVHRREYRAEDLEGAFAALAATDNPDVNASVIADARARGILACAATRDEAADFTMPATLRLGELTFAVDTGGASPAFARRTIDEIKKYFGSEHAAASRTLRRVRDYVKAAVSNPGERRALLRMFAALPVEELAAMNAVQTEERIEDSLAQLRGSAATTTSLICATRASALATIQAKWVAAQLAQHGIASTFLAVTTTGDRSTKPIGAIGSENVFVKELEEALLDGRADYAVHSCKDLPSTLAPGFEIAAFSKREDPRDAYCSQRYPTFESLPRGSKVGTSSPRRRAQLLALRADLDVADMRGNVDTRLRKLPDGEYDAIVIAHAGLLRLGKSAKYCVPFEVDRIVPAVAQGALAVEVLAGNAAVRNALHNAVNDSESELAVVCERAALATLQGGCRAPIGIHARRVGAGMLVLGAVASNGSRIVRASQNAPCSSIQEASELGRNLARALLRQLEAESAPPLPKEQSIP